jgi:RNA polymerase sigma-70 factor, ECF subfamily
MDIRFLFNRATQGGDYKAFEMIFHHFYSPLCRFSVRLVEKPEVAEEIVSDVFFKVWKNRQQIRLTHTPESYLYTAVRNQSLDYLKTRRPRTVEAQPNLVLSGPDTPEQLLIGEDLSARIERAIDQLPDQCRNVFRLSRDQGLKYQEIADTLGISPKTVETQMNRALKSLRLALKASVQLCLLLGLA